MLPARIVRRINFTDDCWLWTGPPNPSGYGQVHWIQPGGKRQKLVHRMVYSLLRGELPEHLHHVCRVRLCVNPDHLESHTVLTHAAIHAKERIKTHCKHGHSLEDCYWITRSTGVRFRACAECKRISSRKSWEALSDERRHALNLIHSERRRQAAHQKK